jgi:ribosomal protein L37E
MYGQRGFMLHMPTNEKKCEDSKRIIQLALKLGIRYNAARQEEPGMRGMSYRRPPPSQVIFNGRITCKLHDFRPLGIREECVACGFVRLRQDAVEAGESEVYHRPPPSHVIMNGRIMCRMHDFTPLSAREDQCMVCGFVRQRQDVVEEGEPEVYHRPPPSHVIMNGRIMCRMHDFWPLGTREERCAVCGTVRQRQESADHRPVVVDP